MIQNRIHQAAIEANRESTEIELIGASKQQSADLVLAFHQAGMSHFGENYLQESLEKQKQLQNENIDWHFIGSIQSNKCKTIAQHFNWVHSIDRLKIAQRLARFRIQNKHAPLKLLVQLNIDQEVSKSGVELSAAPSLCAQIDEIEGIALKGFMLIPAPAKSLAEQRKPFELARTTLEATNQRYGLQLDTLSMGMSNDLEAAILEGATMVRVGTALFGPRS
ncbi:MAG: YggS family pyridoxal phosphate-dependent enzyme [Acidiferrobacterales bacterium]|nr:YggS family pyridoxal phosphate-dependent enzyme [Acidiferrobacterales bacterium]